MPNPFYNLYSVYKKTDLVKSGKIYKFNGVRIIFVENTSSYGYNKEKNEGDYYVKLS